MEKSNMAKEGKPPVTMNVAWWKVGNNALATTEFTLANMIDVHNIKYLGDYEFRFVCYRILFNISCFY